MTGKIAGWLLAILCVLAAGSARAQAPTPITCNGGDLPSQGPEQPRPPKVPKAPPQPNLLIRGPCNVVPGQEYLYGNVNILDNGVLKFTEDINSRTNFWASSIIIENGGTMTAGTPAKPFGEQGGILTIHLYGEAGKSAIDADGNKVPVADQGKGVPCQSPVPNGTKVPCGVPAKVWASNGTSEINGCGPDETSSSAECLPSLPKDDKDRFYQYGTLYGDGGKTTDGCPAQLDGSPSKECEGYFGYKTLAVSFGGSLDLYGYKGASYDDKTNNDHLSSGLSWIRLADDKDLAKDATGLTLERSPGDNGEKWWNANDSDVRIVVTTTDYLPGHSEELKVTKVKGAEVTFEKPLEWKHVGKRFPLATRLAAAAGRMTLDPELVKNGVETRAAVALLTRSIQIVSAGDGFVETPNPHVESFQEASDRTLCPDKITKGCYYFGAQMIARQGFKQVQIQGVEFRQMGQGGRLGHYPVHFHMARTTPPDTYVKDSAVNESMTRWFVIHSTQGVTLARNVGWKSIGHGYYLEDATETDNNFYSNIGIFARAAIDNAQNDRQVPGILDDNQGPQPPGSPDVSNQGFPYRSDSEYPAVFWITNGWNDFIGNMAAGAGTCGACYWLVAAEDAAKPDVPTDGNNDHGDMKWSGYAALQKPAFNESIDKFAPSPFAGATPLKSFYGNYCSSAMHSFQTTDDAPVCNGVIAADAAKPPGVNPVLRAVKSISPEPKRQEVKPKDKPPHMEPDNVNDPYYPHALNGARRAVRCPALGTPAAGEPQQYDCSAVKECAVVGGRPAPDCAVTVLDHYTSAFNWASGAISGVWLRPFWYLVDNSVLSDVQNGALTFVTGGDYTQAQTIPGYWGVARNTIFIGNTQTDNPLAANDGPFNKGIPGSLACDREPSPAGYCLNAKEGVSFPLVNFFVNQRMYNIYDAASYQDGNIYLDITKSPCQGDACIYGANTQGVRRDLLTNTCYLPNAAIAWKQPNGFFYPPAFHSTNLFFDNVDIRHYVIAPLFRAPDGVTADRNFGQGGTYITDLNGVTDKGVKTLQGVKDAYCGPVGQIGQTDNSVFFTGFTGIDRQTELNDDDGSLTGLSNSLTQTVPPNRIKETISLNEDDFFSAPIETPECLSNIGVTAAKACAKAPLTAPAATARTSPYDFVNTVVWHPKADHVWDAECSNETCYGVPLYRQFLTGKKGTDEKSSTGEWAHWFHNGCDSNRETPQCRWPFIRMAGSSIAQRNTLTVNNGTYYLETTVPENIQKNEDLNRSGPESKETLNSFVNVFQNDETYYIFFLYAKETTKQTYQIYVGDKFDEAKDLQAIHMQVPNADFVPEPIETRPSWLKAEPFGTDGPGILTVTVDFNGVTELDPTPANGLCEPHQFCSTSGAKEEGANCGCALDPKNDPLVKADPGLFNECKHVCGTWAVKALDCPEAGCLGFSFTLRGFSADGVLTHRPATLPDWPKPFPTAADPKHLPDWSTRFEPTKREPDASKGQCFYAAMKIPGGTDCPVIQ